MQVSKVGYHIRLEAVAHPTETRLLFCTTGILLRRLQSDPDLLSVSHVVIDEVTYATAYSLLTHCVPTHR